ncbi:DUF4350 domain-containing protein [uncultured Psychroserpens sp.]|uniref:DUF4350 domain-containing protein n=1 Tax=uncultured Psychroserpens sp. TaxID=255436 RepID=UPI00260D2ECB|nr:DUF4350 domain-containing protein [uncultured Psychroserpens sp.]
MLSLNLKRLILVCTLCTSFVCVSQQSADTTMVPKLERPYYKINEGPTVHIDEMHNNFHTKNGRFKPFSDLLKRDGYQVKALINYDDLKTQDILVISNAIEPRNIGNWQQPIYDAFKTKEIEQIKQWVSNGGRLLLIADHMPFSGASNTLANAFGFDFCDGFARLSKPRNQPDVFSKNNQRLIASKLTDGTYGKSLDSITTFTGSSFQIPSKAIGILKFKKGDTCLQPEIAWQFNDDTKTKDLEDNYQGAIMDFGKGKLAVFGEAAQFTAQTITNASGTFKVGFNSKNAPNNIDFIRNLMLWLGSNNTIKQ